MIPSVAAGIGSRNGATAWSAALRQCRRPPVPPYGD